METRTLKQIAYSSLLLLIILLLMMLIVSFQTTQEFPSHNKKDTKGEPLIALSTARNILEYTKVQAIIVPDRMVEVRLLKILEGKANIPTLSFSRSLFSNQNSYPVQAETPQFKSIEGMMENLIFPPETTSIVKRRRLQMKRKKLRIIVPVFGAFPNLIQMAVDPRTNLPTVSGFCGDVFNSAFNALNYGADIEFTPYHLEEGRSYNDVIDKVYFKEFDAAVGDITLTSNRSRYVDFTLPFSDMGVGTITRNAKKGMWVFLDPLSADLWFTSAGFFLILGFVIWFIEHRINEEFQGSTRQQIGTTMWFAFSTLVYAHREKLKSNLSRFVVTVWFFVILVLTSSYTAMLSSLITVQQITSNVGSFQLQGISTRPLYKVQGIVDLRSPAEYANALRRGRVGAIVGDILYVKMVLALYSAGDLSLVATDQTTTNGFAFVFQKDSPLTREMSAEIAKLREDGTLKALEEKWLKNQSSVTWKQQSAPAPNSLNLYRLRGLFLTSGLSMGLALLGSIVCRFREKCHGKTKMEILRCILRRSNVMHAEESDRELPV